MLAQRCGTIGRLTFRSFSSGAALWAGHSKWQNIKHRKARQDAERSSQNTRIANQIYVAVKEGGGIDPAHNIRLATAIESASRISTPKKVIDGAIARAVKAASGGGENALSIAYEGIGPGGVAYIVEALTENRNRTAQQVRAAFLKFKGSLSPTKFLFKRRGWIDLDPSVTDYDAVLEQCLESDGVADVVQFDDKSITVYTDPADLATAAKFVRSKYAIDDMGLAFLPDEEQAVEVKDSETLQRLTKLEAALEGIEDVSNLYNNLARTSAEI